MFLIDRLCDRAAHPVNDSPPAARRQGVDYIDGLSQCSPLTYSHLHSSAYIPVKKSSSHFSPPMSRMSTDKSGGPKVILLQRFLFPVMMVMRLHEKDFDSHVRVGTISDILNLEKGKTWK
jgi:hypothetical protein